MINLTINGQSLEVPDGSTVLQAAVSIGVTIPTLCYHKDLSPFGGCRLCVVEVQGARLPMTSCVLPVNPGMVVQTETPVLHRYRRAILLMLLSNYYDAGYKRNNGDFGLDQDSELAHWAEVYNINIAAFQAKKPRYSIDSDPNPFVWVDMNRCIQCTRCVRACAEIQGRFVWSQSYRGYKARIVAGDDSTMLQSRCESCGACVVYCPTGALDNKMSVNAGRPDRLERTTCAYCSVGCQFDLNVKDDVSGGRVIRVTSHHLEQHAGLSPSVNNLHLCIKGRYGYEFIHHARRHTRPRIRQYLLDGKPRPGNGERGKWVDVNWNTALKIVAQNIGRIHSESGGGAIGILASGHLTNEENYLLNKLARQILHTDHIDCSAHINRPGVTDGLLDSLGVPAMSTNFAGITNEARSMLIIGSNLSEQHPVFNAMVRQAIMHRRVKAVVASPDFINIAEYAALPLYHQPGSEVALLNGLMHIIIQKGWQDQATLKKHPHGFDEFKTVIDEYTPQRAAELTGLSVESLNRAAEILAENRPTAILWSVGISNRGVVQSLANLRLLLGDLHSPGGGVAPLRANNNSQGASDMGAQPGLLPGYQSLSDPAVRRKFEVAWGAQLPTLPGLPASEILDAAGHGRLRALYILGEDILNNSPTAAGIRQDLNACDLIVLQEILPSETTRYADILLPGVSFAEKSGTFTSGERRIQPIYTAIAPIGDSRPDWQIIRDLAQCILAVRAQSGQDAPAPTGPHAAWTYVNTDEILSEIAALTPIYASLTPARLSGDAPVFWPVGGDLLLPPGAFSDGFLRWTPVEQLPFDEAIEHPPELLSV